MADLGEISAHGIEYDVPVSRRVGWVFGAKFYCRICRQSKDTGLCDGADGRSSAFTCQGCARTWGRLVSGIRGLSRGDRSALQRLSAYMTRIEWELMNGTRY